MSERDTVEKFMAAVGITVRHRITKDYADGRREQYELGNVVTGAGRDALASRAIEDTTSPFVHMAVGSGTDAGSLGSTDLTFETLRKAATMSTSNEVIIGVTCWGGAADSITSEYLDEAGLFNHADSGQGTMLNLLTGIDHTFADSDVVKVQMEVSVGSYDA